MKRILIFFLSAMSLVFAEEHELNPTPQFSGEWSLELLFCRNQEGLYVSPRAAYSYPYLGFTRVRFIEDNLLALSFQGEEVKAFYDLEPRDADNLVLSLTFKDNRKLDIRLVMEENPAIYPFYYKITSDIFPEYFVEEEKIANPVEEQMPTPEDSVPSLSAPAEVLPALPPGEEEVKEEEVDPFYMEFVGSFTRLTE